MRRGPRWRAWFVLAAIVAVVVLALVRFNGTRQPSLRTEVIVTGLETPWAVAFAPDTRIFITERRGRVRIVRAGRLEPEPWAVIVVWQFQSRYNAAGLLGLALDPEFARNHFVYIYHTYEADGATWNRVVRMMDRDGHGVFDRVILDKIHADASHDGGRILFGPDGLLYIGTGDSSKSELAQDLASLEGKILRITRDGDIPSGNPFPGSPVYSLGHRNVQGLSWHPKTKRLYVVEHGPTAREGCCRDELNLIEPGKNYGWPVVTAAAGDPRFVDPIVNSGDRETWAPSGATFDTRGPWADSMIFTGLRGETLYRVVFDGPDGLRVARVERYFTREFGRLRDVVEGPDGALYFVTNNIHPIGKVRPGDDKLIKLAVGSSP